jgi:hypothetical protein
MGKQIYSVACQHSRGWPSVYRPAASGVKGIINLSIKVFIFSPATKVNSPATKALGVIYGINRCFTVKREVIYQCMATKFTVVVPWPIKHLYFLLKTFSDFSSISANLGFRASKTRKESRCPCPISCCLLLYWKTPPAYIKKCLGDRYRQATYLVFQQKRAHLGFAASTTRIK